MSRSEYGCALIQNRSRSFTFDSTWYGAASHALTITCGSSGAATGRAPSRKRRVKKSFHDVKPPCGWSSRYWNCDSPMRLLAASQNQPSGADVSRCARECGPPRKPHHTFSTFCRWALTAASRNSAWPDGMHIGQSRKALIGHTIRLASLNGGV